MSGPDPELMQGVAAQCVRLVGEEFARAVPVISEHARRRNEA